MISISQSLNDREHDRELLYLVDTIKISLLSLFMNFVYEAI